MRKVIVALASTSVSAKVKAIREIAAKLFSKAPIAYSNLLEDWRDYLPHTGEEDAGVFDEAVMTKFCKNKPEDSSTFLKDLKKAAVAARIKLDSAVAAAPKEEPVKKVVKKKSAGVLGDAEKVITDTLKALAKAKVVNKGLSLQPQDSLTITAKGSILYSKGSTEKKPLQKIADDGKAIFDVLKQLGYSKAAGSPDDAVGSASMFKVISKVPQTYARFTVSKARDKYFLDCVIRCYIKPETLIADERFQKDILKLVKKYLG
jgi:hypothetical protein